MQASRSAQSGRTIGWQVAVLAAVAALGIAAGFGLGTWVADDGNGTPSTVFTNSATERSDHIIDVKFAQMDAQDAQFGPAVSSVLAAVDITGQSDRIIDMKFAQMDAQDALFGPAASSVLAAVGTPDHSDRIIEMKLAQMDAEDAR